MKYMRITAGYTWTNYKTNAQIAMELEITLILDKLLEYKRRCIQHVNTGRFIMYFGSTKIDCRKTVQHVFTKPVQIEGTTQNVFFFPSKLFSSLFTYLPLGGASVCSEKMAAPAEKSFCVLECHTSKSVVTEQRAFCAKYAKDPPTDKTILTWYKQFTETGCLCKQKAPMLTRVWQGLEYRIDMCLVTRGVQIEHL